MAWPEPIRSALAKTPGAVFRRCALQVNPFGYVQRHRPHSSFTDEPSYNVAVVAACREAGVTVVGITDHHTVHTMGGLRSALLAGGVTVFPGFEVRSKDGVQALVLFEPDTSEQRLERHLGEIGATDPDDPNATAALDFQELLGLEWDAAIVAGQLSYGGGLLSELRGDARRNAWRDPRLLAGALPGPVDAISAEGIRRILRNEDPQYRRDHRIALLYASDVSDPHDLTRRNTSCWLKMTEPTVEGLRAAFRDPESRLRPPDEVEPAAHAELVAAAWTGGFLDGAVMRFSDNLNVLIGGRGTGKSTLIESLRYALGLQPTGSAATAHQQIVNDVLGPGGRIQVLVRSPHPSPATYLVERVVGRAPEVRDEAGVDTGLTPRDVLPDAAVWGQHEIAELEVHESRRIRLIERFSPRDPALLDRKAELVKLLARSREQLADVEDQLEGARERLAALPALEELQRRYEAGGVEKRLREQSLMVREERLLATAADRCAALREGLVQLPEAAAPDRAFLAPSAIEGLPNSDLLTAADDVLARFASAATALVTQLTDQLAATASELEAISAQWEVRRVERQQAFDRLLRELRAEHVDGTEFLALRRRLESILPLRERAARLEQERDLLLADRASLVTDWVAARAGEHAALTAAAAHASARLRRKVRVSAAADGDTGPLVELLRSRVGGRLDLVHQALGSGVRPVELAAWCRQGAAVVAERLGVTENQAQRLCGASASTVREIEELDLPPKVVVELNVGTEQRPLWRPYDDLSKGQKATAALLLLLLGDDAPGPLVVDQPEDDLDNAFIFQTIVPSMRREKRRRQFLFASHDPNIPVLGDAELIAELSTEIVGDTIVGRVGAAGRLGSIDVAEVRGAVEDNLEGGRAAFERRRRMYGF